MDITYLGHSSFRIKAKTGSVVTDPFDPEACGIKFPKTSATIVTISHQHKDHNFFGGVEENPLIIDGPGEYEASNIKVYGIMSYHDGENGAKRGNNTIYRINLDHVSVVHLGDLGHKLTEGQIDSLDGVDILMVPVGGVYTLDPKEASEVISLIEPKVIIPMHYKSEKINKEAFEKMNTLEDFLKEMGKSGIAPVAKYTITADKLPVEQTVVVLE